tara:strand:- start:128 stop:685 length:558 start_codon:yes stop_codon:yes gene_type:complete
MAEVLYAPSVSLLHHAAVTVIPDSPDRQNISFNFAVDGMPGGKETISTTFGSSLMKRYRLFPSPHVIGQVFQVSMLEGGTLSQCEIVVVPVAAYTSVREISEIQMTYEGVVTLDFYFDGTKIGSSREFSSDKYKTEKFYMPSGTRGNLFQYKQVDNTNGEERGYISYMSTDVIKADVEEPSVAQA